MRAVLDANVLVSAFLAPTGVPGELLRRWRLGDFALVASPELLAELDRVLGYSKLGGRLPAGETQATLALIAAVASPDPVDPCPIHSCDHDDDYLIALAAEAKAFLVSGDKHLLELRGQIPVYSPREFLDLLDSR